jgi:hypothetical protein
LECQIFGDFGLLDEKTEKKNIETLCIFQNPKTDFFSFWKNVYLFRSKIRDKSPEKPAEKISGINVE